MNVRVSTHAEKFDDDDDDEFVHAEVSLEAHSGIEVSRLVQVCMLNGSNKSHSKKMVRSNKRKTQYIRSFGASLLASGLLQAYISNVQTPVKFYLYDIYPVQPLGDAHGIQDDVNDEDEDSEDRRCKEGWEALSRVVALVAEALGSPKPIHGVKPLNFKFWATEDADSDEEEISHPSSLPKQGQQAS